MKCPRCLLIVTDQVPHCPGCGFGIDQLAQSIGTVPERSGYVNDFASVLSPEARSGLEKNLVDFQTRAGGELVLVTIDSTKPVKPSEFVFFLFNHWRVGGDAHSGLMLLLALEERRIECEVGYSWEPFVSDEETAPILEEHVVPLLREGKKEAALVRGVEELIKVIDEVRVRQHPPGGQEDMR